MWGLYKFKFILFEVTESEMKIDVRPVHDSNALLPMGVTELGMAIKVRFGQSQNASSPMDVTKSGMA